MGLALSRERFTAEEHSKFGERLTRSLEALRELLARPDFGLGPRTIGSELELHLVDGQGQPFFGNEAVLESAKDDRVTLEISRFNLEVNARPVPLAGRPFKAMEAELNEVLATLRSAARAHGARLALIGILPTLRVAHLEGALSNAPRYRALSHALQSMRREPFAVNVRGRESLSTECPDVATEGANASFQVHLRAAPHEFANLFNAAQLAAAPLLAACTNSPFFDGKSLWDETRIALFQQAVDTRADARERAQLPARVAFGHGWIRDAHERFAANAAMHPPLLPVLGSEDPLEVLRAGGIPQLTELRLHQGTVWNWNRAVFDPADGGHLRIEHRILPSGPTVGDMVANAALTLGLTLGLAPSIEELSKTFSFRYAEQNFYTAAKLGLDAELLWPTDRGPSPRPRPVREVITELLPIARQGLLDGGVDGDEVDPLLDRIRDRVESGRTGAAVQRAWVAELEAREGREHALERMFEQYLAWSEREAPVHTWSGEQVLGNRAR